MWFGWFWFDWVGLIFDLVVVDGCFVDGGVVFLLVVLCCLDFDWCVVVDGVGYGCGCR